MTRRTYTLSGKKAVSPPGFVVAFILAVISFAALLYLMGTMSSDATTAADETMCQMSVAQRTVFQMPVTGDPIGSLQCNTMRETLGDSRETRSQEAVMREMSELSMRCWEMFGKGAMSGLDETGWLEDAVQTVDIFDWRDEKVFCFTCYDVEIEGLDDGPITQGNLEGFMSNNIYVAEGGTVDPCEELGGTDMDECQELREQQERNPCHARGGRCSSDCEFGELSYDHDQWICPDEDNTCCVPSDRAYSYEDYVMYESGFPGTIRYLSPEDEAFNIEEGERYAVMYMEPAGDTISHIAIADASEALDSGCHAPQ